MRTKKKKRAVINILQREKYVKANNTRKKKDPGEKKRQR